MVLKETATADDERSRRSINRLISPLTGQKGTRGCIALQLRGRTRSAGLYHHGKHED
jgi:hypothetical protein